MSHTNEELPLFHDYEYPKVSIVVPTYNLGYLLQITIESVLEQHYPDFELLIVDGGSKDGTVNLIRNFDADKLRFCTINSSLRYEQINRGISQSVGQYIVILLPGDYFLTTHSIRVAATALMEASLPHLLFSGSLIREEAVAKISLKPFSRRLLRRGEMPTLLQGCWFRRDLFELVGRFSDFYQLCSDFEFLCRVSKLRGCTHDSLPRVLFDTPEFQVNRKMIFWRLKEMFRIINSCFGLVSAFYWAISSENIKSLFSLWLKSVRLAFLGRP